MVDHDSNDNREDEEILVMMVLDEANETNDGCEDGVGGGDDDGVCGDDGVGCDEGNDRGGGWVF